MTPSELKYHVENNGTDSHFFDRKTMQFFGDTMRNYGVCSTQIRTCYDSEGKFTSNSGIIVECWELFRKKPVKHGLQKSAFFSKDTFHRVYPNNE